MGMEQARDVSNESMNSFMNIVKDKATTASSIQVYISIVFLIEHGYENMKIERIAELTNLEVRTIIRALKVLKNEGYIQVIRNRHDQKYTILK